jgi:hypothetical protein
LLTFYRDHLLNDGRGVIVAFSKKFDDIEPPCDEYVRAEAILGGFLFTPCAKEPWLVHHADGGNDRRMVRP